MVIGQMSIPDEFGKWDWKSFKEWYSKAMSGNPEKAEDVFILLGGKVPKQKDTNKTTESEQMQQ
jgi:hypothetical protein